MTDTTAPLLGAVILAAGASSRMGTSKAALRVGDDTFLEAAIQRAEWAHAAPIIVVEGAHPLGALFAPGRASICVHPQWADGPLSSLQAGLHHCLTENPTSNGLDAVMVLTIDRPRVRHETIEALRRAVARDPERIWQPRFGDETGHPIVWPRRDVDALLALPTDVPGGPRALLARPDRARARAFVDVSDPHVIENIDRPVDLPDL